MASASAGVRRREAPGELAEPLLADHANLRAALEDAIEHGDEESRVELALGLRPLWLAGMLRQECQELVDRLLGRFSLPGEQEIALLRAVAFLDYSPTAKAGTAGSPAGPPRSATRRPSRRRPAICSARP